MTTTTQGRRRRRYEVAVVAVVGAVTAATLLLSNLRLGGTPPPAQTAQEPDAGLARIDPSTGQAVDWVPIPALIGLAANERGIWVSRGEAGFHTASRLDPRSGAVVSTIRMARLVAAAPRPIAVGQGAVWAIAGDAVYRIDPVSNVVAGRVSGLPKGSNLGAIAVGARAVWVTDPTRQRVYRIDPETNAVSSRLRVPHPGGVAVGHRSVWVTSIGRGEVIQIDPVAVRVTRRIAAPGASFGIAAGAGGVWVTDTGGGSVLWIDPASGAVETIQVGRRPTSVAASDTSVWVVNSRDGTVSAIDAKGRTVDATIQAGPRPYLVEATEGAVWVAVLGTPDEHH